MAKRSEKIGAYLLKAVSEAAFTTLRDSELSGTFGIVSVDSVKVTPDYSYADVYVSSLTNADQLPKALAPFAAKIRGNLSRSVGLHRAPIIWFRTKKEGDSRDAEMKVLSIIDEFSKKHGGT